ncbi:GlxA family transcriptional regulator [Sphaerisporangium corydalis]|uniref:GlxA family transcriptional regulator n=1 Tax=Sphaerisporangium corydalis TaxID=1441875 RepID=A0ABV9EI66_9ACTN|nr:helix-turn-helix domain-containing protein [Sphaerisporangium corydalis]
MRTVAALIYDDMRAFDYAVMAEVWGMDRADGGVPAFELRRCSVDGRPVRMHPGARVEATHGLDGLAGADLVVAPGREDPSAPVPAAIIEALRAAHAGGGTIASLCSGAFVLAAAGILEGRRAVTHWLLTERLARDHPGVTVVPDVLFMEDGGVWTAAGTAGGVDLCLELVRRAHGAAVANTIARRMVTAAHRDGGQAQFVERPVPQMAGGRSAVTATLEWARGHLSLPLTVTDLARHARSAPRTFARDFVSQTGATPAQWLIRQRVTEAQRLLETTDLSIEQVATRCGFGTATMLRRHFARILGTTPTRYRHTFAHT